MRKVILLSAFIFFGTFFACKKEGSVVPSFNSSNLSPGDTIIEVVSSTEAGDSVLTSGTSRNLLGKLNDLVFGLSTADFYTQIRLSSTSLNIPDEVNFDSVVLYLAYDKYYGFLYQQDVKIYRLTEDFGDESELYSTNTMLASETELGSASLSITEADTFSDSTYVLRIKLDNALADEIKNKASFADQDAWLDFFKGIKVTTDPLNLPSDAGDGEGAIIYFNLLSTKTKLSLYYQSNSTTTSEDFVIDNQSLRFTHFENTYSDSLNAALGKENLNYNFISAMSGCRTKITFPDLSVLSKMAPVAINKAELIIPYEEPVPAEYLPPDRNVIILKDDEGQWVLPDDFFKGGSDYFGGNLNLSDKTYNFNLASTLHDMINHGKTDKELFLSISGSAVTANRLKLNSGIHPARKIYLILSYTKSR